MTRPLSELKDEGHLRLGTGDFIGWNIDDDPVYGRASDGSGGVLKLGEDERAIRIAEADLEHYRERLLFLESWIADMKVMEGAKT